MASSSSLLGRGARAMVDVDDPSARARGWPAVAVWGCWALWTATAAVLVLALHEPWGDEVQAWALVRASGTPWDLLVNLRHEGHPPVWYALLWPVAKVVPGVIGLQAVTVAVGSAATWVVLRHLPLALPVRVALVLGYFPLFELGTIARSYAVAWLLTVVALWLAHRRATPDWVLYVVLLALAGTTVVAAPLAVGIGLARWGGPWFASRTRGPARRAWLAALLVPLAVGAVVAWPSGDGGPPVSIDASTSTLVTALTAPLRALVPIFESRDEVWNAFVVGRWTRRSAVAGVAGLAVLAWCVRRSRSALTTLVVGAVGATALIAVFLTSTGHWLPARLVSLVFMAVVAAMWFAAGDRLTIPVEARRPLRWPVVALAAGVLLASLVGSAQVVGTDARLPFSTAEATATWIAEEADGDDVVVLCAANRFRCNTVAAFLDVASYVSVEDGPTRFVDWRSGWWRTLPPEDLPTEADDLAAATGATVFVVADAERVPPGCEGGRAREPRRMLGYEDLVACRADQLQRVAG